MLYLFFILYLQPKQTIESMARPVKAQSKDIRQSNYFTTAKYDYTLQEKIILYADKKEKNYLFSNTFSFAVKFSNSSSLIGITV